MANSTAVITDTTTLMDTAYTSASMTKSASAEVVLWDNAEAACSQLKAAKASLIQLQANLDSADPQLTLVTSILGTLA